MGKLSPLGTMTPGVEIERRCRNPALAIIGFPAPEPIVLRVLNLENITDFQTQEVGR